MTAIKAGRTKCRYDRFRGYLFISGSTLRHDLLELEGIILAEEIPGEIAAIVHTLGKFVVILRGQHLIEWLRGDLLFRIRVSSLSRRTEAAADSNSRKSRARR